MAAPARDAGKIADQRANRAQWRSNSNAPLSHDLHDVDFNTLDKSGSGLGSDNSLSSSEDELALYLAQTRTSKVRAV